jgi:hypothetical protein
VRARGRKALLGVVVALTLAILIAAAMIDPPGPGDIITLLLPLSFLATGAIVTHRQPDNLEAWLLTGTGLAWAIALTTPFDGSWVVPVCLMTVHLPLRFPTGQLPSPKWRLFSWLAVALTAVLPLVVTTSSRVTAENEVNPYYLQWTGPLGIMLALLPICMIVAVASLVARYRRGDSLQRHQVRWIAWAGGLIVTIYTLTLVTSLLYDSLHDVQSQDANWFGEYPWWLSALQFTALLSFLLIPLSFSIAILRYRLYDIDRLISRTVSYLLLSGLLVAVYVAVVGMAGVVFEGLDSFGVAIATLSAAALMRPLLRRIQTVVDRRFNRAGYDAPVVTTSFSAQLRDEVDPEIVMDAMCQRVRESVEPSSLAWWIRDPRSPITEPTHQLSVRNRP